MRSRPHALCARQRATFEFALSTLLVTAVPIVAFIFFICVSMRTTRVFGSFQEKAAESEELVVVVHAMETR